MAADLYAPFSELGFDRPAEGVLRITLSTPGRLNAVGAAMHRQLAGVWKAVDEDDETRAVIVRGSGGAFSAGGDLELVLEIAGDFETRARVFNEARDLVYNVVNCAKPIVSAMTGPAVGAGLAVGLLADISIATPEARIVDGHTKLALNNWLRLAGPAFDASLALEFLDMTGPDVHEGVAAVREKRRPAF
jgi:enoyl-CoA hydratase